jgi:hypothetical protein
LSVALSGSLDFVKGISQKRTSSSPAAHRPR